MEITLTDEEQAIALAHCAVRALSITSEYANEIPDDSNLWGSHLIVARIFNLYLRPGRYPMLVGRNHNRIEVIWSEFATVTYKAKFAGKPDDIMVVVTGSFPKYTIRGWAMRGNLVGEKDGISAYVYDHILHPIGSDWTYPELG